MKYLSLLLVFLSTVALADPPASYMKKEMGFDPPYAKYTLKEFADNAFKNVVSKEWLDMGDNKWLLSIVGRDAKKNRESRMKFIFGINDSGKIEVESIVMDGQDVTGMTDQVTSALMRNVQEKLGVRQTMEQYQNEQLKSVGY